MEAVRHVGAAAILAAALTACAPRSPAALQAHPHAGGITIAGSTALLPLAKDAADTYQAQHRDVAISVSGGGSGTGLNQVEAQAIDIGDSDILAVDHPELVDHRVAVVGFALVVNPDARVTALTRSQVADIFTGKITNWNQVGGADEKVVVVNRPRSSGTRAVFRRVMLAGALPVESGLTEDATGTVVNVVTNTPGAISYAALSGVRKSALTLPAIDGVAPTPAAIASGRYPFWSYEHMFTRGAPRDTVAAFLAFVAGSRDLLERNAFIPVSSMRVHSNDR